MRLTNSTILIYVCRTQNDERDTNFTLLTSLLETLRVVVATSSKHQRAFNDAGAFIKVISLLVNNEDPSQAKEEDKSRVDELLTLCSEVIQTLTILMMNNTKNKEQFKDNIGYDQLVAVILYATGNHPTSMILNLLFDMVCLILYAALQLQCLTCK